MVSVTCQASATPRSAQTAPEQSSPFNGTPFPARPRLVPCPARPLRARLRSPHEREGPHNLAHARDGPPRAAIVGSPERTRGAGGKRKRPGTTGVLALRIHSFRGEVLRHRTLKCDDSGAQKSRLYGRSSSFACVFVADVSAYGSSRAQGAIQGSRAVLFGALREARAAA
jgi:hypothetical protein